MTGKQTAEAWLCFEEAEESYFVKSFLKKDFSHIYLLKRDDYAWIQLEMAYDLALVKVLACENSLELVYGEGAHCHIKEKPAHILYVEFEISNKAHISYNPINCLNCASFAKMWIGMSAWKHTPYSIYKYLHKMEKTGKYKKGILRVKTVKPGELLNGKKVTA